MTAESEVRKVALKNLAFAAGWFLAVVVLVITGLTGHLNNLCFWPERALASTWESGAPSNAWEALLRIIVATPGFVVFIGIHCGWLLLVPVSLYMLISGKRSRKLEKLCAPMPFNTRSEVQERDHTQCRACGTKLTIVNRALDLPGYCGKCAASVQAPAETGELPLDADPEAIAIAPRTPDMIRLTMIALLATVLCFNGGWIVGAIAGGADPMNRLDTSLRVSWLFCLAGVFLGRFVFLRRGNALTFARWRVFWSWFVGAYFVAYIPLAILLPRQQMIPLPWVDLAAFLSACIFAYASSMLVVLQGDRKLRGALCERTPVTKSVLDEAREGNLDEAYHMVEEATKRCGGIVRAEDHLYLYEVRSQGSFPADAAFFV